MARSSRTSLMLRTEVARADKRRGVALAGRCQIGEGAAAEVEVTDLAAHGCRLRGLAVGVTKADALRLWLGEIGPIAARLKWAKSGAVGLAFDAPLDPATLASCVGSPGEGTVVPLRRSALR